MNSAVGAETKFIIAVCAWFRSLFLFGSLEDAPTFFTFVGMHQKHLMRAEMLCRGSAYPFCGCPIQCLKARLSMRMGRYFSEDVSIRCTRPMRSYTDRALRTSAGRASKHTLGSGNVKYGSPAAIASALCFGLIAAVRLGGKSIWSVGLP